MRTIEEIEAMRDEERRIKTAELCGWKWGRHNGRLRFFDPEFWAKHPNIQPDEPKDYPCLEKSPYPIPNYLTDLNAMYTAEEGLSDEQTQKYIEALAEVTGAHQSIASENWTCFWCIYHAIARQRNTAFLMVMLEPELKKGKE